MRKLKWCEVQMKNCHGVQDRFLELPYILPIAHVSLARMLGGSVGMWKVAAEVIAID